MLARINLLGMAHGCEPRVDGPLHQCIEHHAVGREIGVAESGRGRQKIDAAPIAGRPHKQGPAIWEHGQWRALAGNPAGAANLKFTDR